MAEETHDTAHYPEETGSALAIPLAELVTWQNDNSEEVTKLKRIMYQRLGDNIVGELAPEDAFQLGKIAMGEAVLNDFAAFLEAQSNIVAGNLDIPDQLQRDR